MVTFSRLAAYAAALSLSATFVTLPAAAHVGARDKGASAKEASTPIAQDENARRLWADDAMFSQLSSAAQARLIRAFGPRPGTPAPAPTVDRPFAMNFDE